MGLSLGSMKLLTDACSYSGGMLALSSFRCARPASTHSHFSAPEIPPRSTIFQPDPPQIEQTSTAFIASLYQPAAVLPGYNTGHRPNGGSSSVRFVELTVMDLVSLE